MIDDTKCTYNIKSQLQHQFRKEYLSLIELWGPSLASICINCSLKGIISLDNKRRICFSRPLRSEGKASRILYMMQKGVNFSDSDKNNSSYSSYPCLIFETKFMLQKRRKNMKLKYHPHTISMCVYVTVFSTRYIMINSNNYL